MSRSRTPDSIVKVLQFATIGLAVWGILACLVCFLIWSSFPAASELLWRAAQLAVFLAISAYLIKSSHDVKILL